MHPFPSPRFAQPSAVVTAMWLSLMAPHQQAFAADNTLPPVVIKAPAAREAKASISGWGDTPPWQAPVQALRVSSEALDNAGVQRLADVTKLDASTTDAYNTTGYWDYLSMRGFTLDNASNYRREGLPINAETRIGLENKSAIELFKGTSGLQAGISAPGGLVNFLVKRPEGRIRQAEIAFTGGSSIKTAVDLSDRFGAENQFGLRVNAATERLDPDTQASQGHRHLVALAGQWTLSPRSSIDIEVEHSVQRQASMPGFSALGLVLPNAKSIDPATNLNQQPWTLPVDLRGNTGSIRWQQQWEAGWRSVVTYGEQHLLSNDRAAFPYGCDKEGNYDRFCSDGTVDLYDFRSDGERRNTRALNGQLTGTVKLGTHRHDITVGLLRALHTTDIQREAYNPVGPISIYSPNTGLGPDSSTKLKRDRHERSTEWSLQDAITFTDQWHAWLGVRQTQLLRTSAPDNPADPVKTTVRDQTLTTPWLALGYTLAPQTQVYASWGEGAEVKTAPGSSDSVTVNQRDVMPANKSRQVEVGIKAQHDQYAWGANLFHIQRPEYGVSAGLFQLDGQSTHQGLEGYWQMQQTVWGMNASAMVIHAKRQNSSLGLSGLSPTNVPHYTLKWSGSYRLPADVTQGLRTTAYLDMVNEGARWADQTNTLRIPAWTRLDTSLQAVQSAGNKAITWRLGVTNLLNTRAWRESPSSFGHIWLFPMAARTWTASAQIDF